MLVELEYTQGNKTVLTTISLPDGWHELNGKSWRAAIGLKIAHESFGFNEKKYRKDFSRLIIDAPVGVDELLLSVSFEKLVGIVEQLEWMKETPEHEQSYMRGNWLLHGPKYYLSDFNMKQFGLAQQFIFQFGKAQDDRTRIEALRGLMAVTWRPSFLPWKSWLCDVYVKLMKLVPNRYLELNLYNVWGMIQSLQYNYEWVYDGSSDGDGPDHGFRSLLESLAGEKFGHYYQVQNALLHDVMVHLDHNAHRVSKLKENNKTTNTD